MQLIAGQRWGQGAYGTNDKEPLSEARTIAIAMKLFNHADQRLLPVFSKLIRVFVRHLPQHVQPGSLGVCRVHCVLKIRGTGVQ